MLLRAEGRGRDAERAFRACVDRDPSGQGSAMDARTELLKLLALEGRADEFKELAWETYEVMPEAERLTVLTARMRLEMEQAKPETDIAALRKLVGADPDDTQARAGLAAALGRANQAQAAREHFARALAERSDNVEIREHYLDLLYNLGDLSGLKAVLDRRPEAAEGRPKTWKYLGILAEKSGDLDAAARAFARAAELDPSEPEYPHRLSLLLFRRGQKAEAERQVAERARLRAARSALRTAWNDFADAFESRPPQVTRDHLLGMARACDSARWWREAAAFYRGVLRISPGDAEARSGLERLSSPPPA
jgi:Tfp pilus assembly protein PilF